MKFFVDDYLSEPKLSFCSLAARGLWFHMLCLMHKNGRRGYLDQEDGQALSLEKLARSAGVSTEEASRLVQELSDSGVSSVTDKGVIYNRRMVREESLYAVRAAAGRKGGSRKREPIFAKQKGNQSQSKPLEFDLESSSSSKEENALIKRPEFGLVVKGEGEFAKQKEKQSQRSLAEPDDSIDAAASWMAREWDIQNKKTVNGRKTESVEDAIPVMVFLLEQGIDRDTILADIRSRKRDRTEWLGDIKKRLLAGRKANGMNHEGIKAFLSRGTDEQT